MRKWDTLRLDFYPDSDNPDFVKAAAEYTQIWHNEGQQIVEAIGGTSGLSFKENEITAVIFEGPGYSYPLRLTANQSTEFKKAELVHELCHRIVKGNHLKNVNNVDNDLLVSHKRIYLILYDVLVKLYGKEFADRIVEKESKISKPEYKQAWEWALAMTSEERIRLFKELKG